MYRTLAGLLVAVVSALSLAWLTFSATVQKRADVRIINTVEPETLDPQQLTSSAGGRIVTAMFEGLTRPDARSLAPAPGVAESWDISDDGMRYTFHLRDNCRWSDGTPLVATDFIYSWGRILAPETAAKYAYMLHPLRGARAINTFDGLARAIEEKVAPGLALALAQAGATLSAESWRGLFARLPITDSLKFSEDPRLRVLLGAQAPEVTAGRLAQFIEALPGEAERLRRAAQEARSRFGVNLGVYATDPRTLVVELEAPTPYFLDITSFYPAFPVPRHVLEKHGESWFLPGKVVANGPFLLEDWRVGDRIRLRKNPDYWGRDEVRAEAIELLPIENVTTALNMYLTHEADWLPSFYPTDLVGELRKRPDFYVHAGFAVYFYRFNTTRPPLDDVRVRKAINLAIDRQVIVDQVLGLGQLPATTFVPPGVPGYEPPPSPLGLDVEQARALLGEAGFEGGRGFPTIGILYNTLDQHKKIAEVIADQLRRNLGIDVRPYNQEWQSYMATTRALQYDMARGAWIGDYVDPNTFLDLLVTNAGNNQTGFSSGNYDSLLRAAGNMVSFAAAPEPLLATLKRPALVQSLLERRAHSSDVSERRALLDEARMRILSEAESILVADEFPVLPIYFYVNSGLKDPALRGMHTTLERADGTRSSNLQPLHPLRDLWMERAAP
jgi:oligopeptide transport system substrate-binding protein